MAQNKPTPTVASPSAFIDQVADEQRRKDCKALVALVREGDIMLDDIGVCTTVDPTQR
ncbi:MAG TPA: hypothetical protein VFO21_26230 [Vicinamibacterales bacterium]|nr:hypothetical protein [Vicinamibacterales bacterium]